MIITATKDMRLWHIEGVDDETLCLRKSIDYKAEIEDIPDNTKVYCQECLSIFLACQKDEKTS